VCHSTSRVVLNIYGRELNQPELHGKNRYLLWQNVVAFCAIPCRGYPAMSFEQISSQPRPSAQEILERRREARKEQQTAFAAIVEEWKVLFPDLQAPSFNQCLTWLRTYDLSLVLAGLDAANKKSFEREQQKEGSRSGPMNYDDVVRYSSGTMRNMKALEEEQ
jgi:hypothetical protein